MTFKERVVAKLRAAGYLPTKATYTNAEIHAAAGRAKAMADARSRARTAEDALYARAWGDGRAPR